MSMSFHCLDLHVSTVFCVRELGSLCAHLYPAPDRRSVRNARFSASLALESSARGHRSSAVRFAAGSFDTHAVLGGFGPRQLGFAESGNFTTSAMCVGGFRSRLHRSRFCIPETPGGARGHPTSVPCRDLTGRETSLNPGPRAPQNALFSGALCTASLGA